MTRETARVASIVATSVWLVAVVWGVAFAMLLWLASREATQRFDDDLASLARTVLAFAEPDLEKTKEQSGLIDRTDARVADRHLYQVWKSDGTLAFQSKGAPSGALTTGTEGFAETEINGIALRTYTTWNATHTFQVQMGVGLRERAWSMLGRPGVFSVFVLAALLMVIHRRPGARYAAQPPASAEAVGDPVNGMLTFAGPRQAPASTVQASSSLVAGPHTARASK